MTQPTPTTFDLDSSAPGTAFRAWLADDSIPWGLAAVAFGGSYTHLVDLAERAGIHGGLAFATAACVDAIVAMCARERQRDKRTNREARGWCSWPFLVMAGGTCLSLASQLAEATHSAWGYIEAAIPLFSFLLALSIVERRTAENDRRQAAARAAAIEAERQEGIRQAAAERQRLEAEQAERDRQAEERRQDRELRERQQRLAEQLATVNGAPSAPAVNGAPSARRALTVTRQPAIAGRVVDGAAVTDLPDRSTATEIMREHWDAEVAQGRIPSGADLLRAAGVPETSSLGRQNAAKWRKEIAATVAQAAATVAAAELAEETG
jgi:Protein of unknown function (DUF2637)